jgi:hypothetical protein
MAAGRAGWGWVAAVLVVLGGCRSDQAEADPPATAGTPRIAPLTPGDPSRIAPEQRRAIAALAETASALPPPAGMHAHGHEEPGPATTVPLTAGERARFEDQWAAAASAVPALDTAAERSAAGYTRAAVQASGIGVHWVNWTLIDAPFDPARPAMLLVDERDGRDDLVGFSYWVRADAPPAGFAGANDVWHQHSNLCIVNGWVDREGAASVDACAGDLLAGSDLWMLHAWVVPTRPNRWGDFAVRNPSLCPGRGTPDILRCPGT